MTSAPFNEKKRRFWIKYYIFRQSSFLRQSSRRLHASMLPPGNLFFQFNNSIAGNSDSLIIFERKSIQNLTISNGRLEASYFRLYYINFDFPLKSCFPPKEKRYLEVNYAFQAKRYFQVKLYVAPKQKSIWESRIRLGCQVTFHLE